MLTRLFALLLVAFVLVPIAAAQEGRSLDLTINDTGIAIGDAERVNGLRLNFRDRYLREVNGINLTLWTPYYDSTRVRYGTVNGLALGLPSTGAGEINGLGRGVLGVVADDAFNGTGAGGLAVVSGDEFTGVGGSGLAAVVHPYPKKSRVWRCPSWTHSFTHRTNFGWSPILVGVTSQKFFAKSEKQSR